jgi:hypothetical protein
LLTILVFGGCGSTNQPESGDTETTTTNTPTDPSQEETPLSYKGLQFYYDPLPASAYTLEPLSDDAFDALSSEKKLAVAHKLLSTFFFGYPLEELKSRIARGNFLSNVRAALQSDTTDKAWLENYILDDSVFRQFDSSWYQPQALIILNRFFAMNKLDRYYLHNWIAYTLTQTILFSPAYELASTHAPNIAGVYNRLVTMLETGAGMRYITYVHMSSEDNWRRFRSPEDNGREMLEIYLLDTDDSHVPLAGKALQNWKLNTDSDTLEVGLNRNTTPISLFGTTVYTGDDFYRELVKSDAFVSGVTRRLVDFFFPKKSVREREAIVRTLVRSHPETWQDILVQIVFSKTYLLDNARAKSAEEVFFPLAKTTHFRNRRTTLYEFKEALESMHQATMKYKLGKLERVPLDTLSFAHYHKFIRERVLLNRADPNQTDHDSWNYDGWQESFIAFDRFAFDEDDPRGSLHRFIDYLFESVIARKATADELRMFDGHMLTTEDGHVRLRNPFNMCYRHDDPETEQDRRARNKREIAYAVLDYLSRLSATYAYTEVH